MSTSPDSDPARSGTETSPPLQRGIFEHPLLRYLVMPVIGGLLVLLIQGLLTQRNEVVAQLQFSEQAIPPTLIHQLTEYGKHLDRRLDLMADQQRENLSQLHSLVFPDKRDTPPTTSDADDRSKRMKEAFGALNDIAFELGMGADRLPATWPVGDAPLVDAFLSRTRFGVPTVMWRGNVENRQGVAAKGVRLQVPRAVYVNIERPGVPDVAAKVDRVVNIGDIQAGERIAITVWCEDGFQSDAADIVLRHDEGIGEVTAQVPVDQSWAQLAEVWKAFKGVCFFVSAVLVLMMGIFAIKDRVDAKRKAAEDMQKM
jgi:hypothetical protein